MDGQCVIDKERFIVLAKALKSAYAKPDFLPDEKAIKVWYAMLQDIPYEVLNLAIQRHIMTSVFPPTIAELRSSAADIVTAEADDWTEAWGKVLDVVSRYGLQNAREGISELDEITVEAVKRVGYWSICNSENIGVERANFRTAYETIVARKKTQAVLSPKLIGQIEAAREKNTEYQKKIVDKNINE